VTCRPEHDAAATYGRAGEGGRDVAERSPAGEGGRDVAERGPACEGGQASVELVALLPVAAVVALAAGQLLAAGQARELAGNAAGAGAVALVQGADPRDAAVAALPGWSRKRVTLRVHGRRVVVRLRPRAVLPGLSRRLTATAAADAGPTR
jgi:hypothetical protein